MKNKRGVSELVVIVLLISVVVGVGAGIFGWMQSYIEGGKESVNNAAYDEIFCGSDVDLKVWSRSNIAMLCLNDSTKIISVYIENNGIELEKLFIRLIAINQSDVFYINVPFDRGDVKKVEINYSKVPNFSELIIFPILLDRESKQHMCKNKYIKVSRSKIPECSYLGLFYY